MVLIIILSFSFFRYFSKWLKRVEWDAETSGNPPKDCMPLGAVPPVVLLAYQGFAIPFKLFYDILTFTV